MRHFLSAPLLAAFALLLSACTGDRSTHDRRLLERFVPDAGSAVPEAFEVEGSRRESLLTREGFTWRADLREGDGTELAFAVTLASEDPSEVSVEALDGEQADAVWSASLSDSVTWREERLVIPRGTTALRLRSNAPVAWAEPRLLAAEDGTEVPTVQAAEASGGALPNLVLVLLDTVRADHLSTYGYDRSTTPNLDRLAARSWVFTRAYSPSTWTLPSTASLLSGLMPLQHGARSLNDALPESVETVAERLRTVGYRTVALTDGGFTDPKWGMAQGFDRYDVTPGKPWQDKDIAPIVERAATWLTENRYQPFFLVVHSYETHQPYTNPEGFADDFLDPAYAGTRFRRRAAVQPLKIGQVSAAEQRRLVDFYDGEIRRADHYLGELLSAFERGGVDDGDALVLTSDHGEEFFDHGGVEHGHGRVFDPNVRVPMVVRPPGGAAAGERFDMPVSGLDVAPTLLAFAGLEPRPEMVGRSLVELARAGDVSNRSVLVHGTNSMPNLDEERFRLDLATTTLIHDLRRSTTSWYDRVADPELRAPLAAPPSPEGELASELLRATLAWLAPARFAVRLPAGVGRVQVSETSKIRPVGVWDGFEWSGGGEDEMGWGVELGAPGEIGHAYLIFDPRPERAPWELTLVAPDGTSEQVEISARRAAGEALSWRPLDGELPPPLVFFETSAAHAPNAAELSDESVEELRALGYL